MKYFKEYYNDGYKYITVEGGNRHDSTYLFWKNVPIYRDRKIKMVIIKSVDRQTMHEVYIRLAYGNPPNRQEVRTGIYGFLSDRVREISEKFSYIFLRIKGIKTQRMLDDELIAKTYGYTKYVNLCSDLDDKIDADYEQDSPTNINDFELSD